MDLIWDYPHTQNASRVWVYHIYQNVGPLKGAWHISGDKESMCKATYMYLTSFPGLHAQLLSLAV